MPEVGLTTIYLIAYTNSVFQLFFESVGQMNQSNNINMRQDYQTRKAQATALVIPQPRVNVAKLHNNRLGAATLLYGIQGRGIELLIECTIAMRAPAHSANSLKNGPRYDFYVVEITSSDELQKERGSILAREIVVLEPAYKNVYDLSWEPLTPGTDVVMSFAMDSGLTQMVLSADLSPAVIELLKDYLVSQKELDAYERSYFERLVGTTNDFLLDYMVPEPVAYSSNNPRNTGLQLILKHYTERSKRANVSISRLRRLHNEWLLNTEAGFVPMTAV